MTEIEFGDLSSDEARAYWQETHGPITLEDTLEDLDAAVDRLRSTGLDHREERRALREYLGIAHELREHLKGDRGKGWFIHAKASEGGRVLEGLMYVRGRRAHGFTRAVAYPALTGPPPRGPRPTPEQRKHVG